MQRISPNTENSIYRECGKTRTGAIFRMYNIAFLSTSPPSNDVINCDNFMYRLSKLYTVTSSLRISSLVFCKSFMLPSITSGVWCILITFNLIWSLIWNVEFDLKVLWVEQQHEKVREKRGYHHQKVVARGIRPRFADPLWDEQWYLVRNLLYHLVKYTI